MCDSSSADRFIQSAFQATSQVGHVDEVRDRLHLWASRRMSLVADGIMAGQLTPTAPDLSYIAQSVLSVLLPVLEQELASWHQFTTDQPAADKFGSDESGQDNSGRAFAVLALGKLGGCELSFNSDLDLIFVCDSTPSNHRAERAVGNLSSAYPDAHIYYTRLAQLLLKHLSPLFRVDPNLRPYGRDGALVCTFESLASYLSNPLESWQRDKAWSWEYQTLLRSRIIYPCQEVQSTCRTSLTVRLKNLIHQALTQPRDPIMLARDIASMRVRMAKTHSSRDIWSIKYFRGGLVDVEFITQYLQLVHAARYPSLLTGNTNRALRKLKHFQLLGQAQLELLLRAHTLYAQVQSLTRLMTTRYGSLAPQNREQLAELIVSGSPGGSCDRRPNPLKSNPVATEILEQRLRQATDEVYRLFQEVIEKPRSASATEAAISSPPRLTPDSSPPQTSRKQCSRDF